MGYIFSLLFPFLVRAWDVSRSGTLDQIWEHPVCPKWFDGFSFAQSGVAYFLTGWLIS